MYVCENWTVKNAEHWRIDGFELWTSSISNLKESIQKEISPEYSLEGLMLKLKLQYFGHLFKEHVSNSLEKTLMLGNIEAGGEGDDRGQNCWMASPTQRAWIWASSRRWGRTGKPRVQQSIGSTESNMTERLNNSNVTWNKWITFISKEVSTINRKPFHILFDFYTYPLILNFELNY